VTDLRTAFRDQAKACRALGSPFMHRLFTLLADDWPGGTQLAAACDRMDGDPGPAGVSLPLRIGGGLHALRLGGDAALDAVYPPAEPGETAFRTAILDALRRHDAFLTDWISSPPQTNEIRRSAALIPAARAASERFGLPIRLSELGASGGLNLMWDRFALIGPGWQVGPADAVVTLAPDWDGPPPPRQYSLSSAPCPHDPAKPEQRQGRGCGDHACDRDVIDTNRVVGEAKEESRL